MESGIAYVSRDGKGKMKLDYLHDGKKRTRLWEERSGGILETIFDSNGYILVQRLLKLDPKSAERKLSEVLSESKLSNVIQMEYSDIKFERPCPQCGKGDLVRYVEAYASKSEVPVMPLYHCINCSTKSYYLTNEYLEYLVVNNSMLFTEDELFELSKDKSRFISDIKEYIIRIFASKKIMCIR